MTASLITILQQLNAQNIEYILVGGMAAVLHGAPMTTQDIDIVHRRTEENIDRLVGFLENVHARYRGQPKNQVLFPTSAALLGTGHNNLMTDFGPLDLLCELASGQGYDQLLPFTESMEDGTGTSVRVITLEKLIEIKVNTARPKDQLMIPILLKIHERS
ncbi:MAG: hypothetical protein JXR76_04300 [Deltaproteobacteria bacterium]|nr:hypothetical protein [Deltaproteobacteria bacterium]